MGDNYRILLTFLRGCRGLCDRASWLLPRLGIHLGAGLVAAIINATIGAIVLLVIIRLVRGGGRW